MKNNFDPECIFCRIVAGELPAQKIWEDEHFIAILDIKPVNLGHMLLLPKAHYKNIFDLPAPLVAGLGLPLQILATAIRSGTEAEGVNIVMNNESAAGQLVNHAHLHLIPRFSTDGLSSWPARENITLADIAQIAEKIKDGL